MVFLEKILPNTIWSEPESSGSKRAVGESTSNEVSSSWRRNALKACAVAATVLAGGVALYGTYRALNGADNPEQIKPSSKPICIELGETPPTPDKRVTLLDELNAKCAQAAKDYCVHRGKSEGIDVEEQIIGPLVDENGQILVDPVSGNLLAVSVPSFSLKETHGITCLGNRSSAIGEVRIKDGHIYLPVELKGDDDSIFPSDPKISLLFDEAETASLRRLMPDVARNCVDLNSGGKRVSCSATVKPTWECGIPENPLA